mmetsp:Transcript_20016/g.53119  ORF Transcript_20016/g.53119 Transcript_20016/m.53119 type:complete len:499 (-) Transcript_20016:606-2102(-)
MSFPANPLPRAAERGRLSGTGCGHAVQSHARCRSGASGRWAARARRLRYTCDCERRLPLRPLDAHPGFEALGVPLATRNYTHFRAGAAAVGGARTQQTDSEVIQGEHLALQVLLQPDAQYAVLVSDGLSAAVEVPDAVVEEQVEDELAGRDARCLEPAAHAEAAERLVLGPEHADRVAADALPELDVLAPDSGHLELDHSDELVLQALLVEVGRWWLEGNVLRDQLAKVREDPLRLHEHAVPFGNLELQTAGGPVDRRVALLVGLDPASGVARAPGLHLPANLQHAAVEANARGGLQIHELWQQRREIILQQARDGALPLPDALELVQQLEQVCLVLRVVHAACGAGVTSEADVVDAGLLVHCEDEAAELPAIDALVLGRDLLPEELLRLPAAARGAEVVRHDELVLALRDHVLLVQLHHVALLGPCEVVDHEDDVVRYAGDQLKQEHLRLAGVHELLDALGLVGHGGLQAFRVDDEKPLLGDVHHTQARCFVQLARR